MEEFEPEAERETVQMLVRLDNDLRRWLRQEARESGRSMTWIVSNAIRQYRNKLERGRQS